MGFGTTGLFIWSWTLVGRILIWVFNHLAHLPNRFCHIPICPRRIGQMVEQSKFKSTKPSPRADELPCTLLDTFITTHRLFCSGVRSPFFSELPSFFENLPKMSFLQRFNNGLQAPERRMIIRIEGQGG